MRQTRRRRWRHRLFQGACVVLALLLAWAALRLLAEAEGDLRQVRAPGTGTAAVAVLSGSASNTS